jgi:hypothetical protein
VLTIASEDTGEVVDRADDGARRFVFVAAGRRCGADIDAGFSREFQPDERLGSFRDGERRLCTRHLFYDIR